MAGGGIYFISVSPQGSQKIINALEKAGQETAGMMVEARQQTATALKEVIRAQFQNAFLQNSDAFPPGYLIQLLFVLDQAPMINDQTSPYSFQVGFNFGDLGDREELSRGYHYGAMLQSGGRVTLPYYAAPLKNDIDRRYLFWQAVRFTLTFEGRPIPNTLWDDTISARLAYWSSIGKAPQWLLVQYGQEEYEPTNPPYPIVENTRAAIAYFGESYMKQALKVPYEELRSGNVSGKPEIFGVLGEYLDNIVNAVDNSEVEAAIQSIGTLPHIEFESFLGG